MKSNRANRARSAVTIVVTLAMGAMAFQLVSGCLDTTPVYVPPRDSAAIEGQPCLSCISKPPSEQGCLDYVAKCDDDPECHLVYACVVPNACLDRPTIDDKISCALPCLREAGIVSPKDRPVEVLLEIVKCGQERCPQECGVEDGGIELDAF